MSDGWKESEKAWKEAAETWEQVPYGMLDGACIGGGIGIILSVVFALFMYFTGWHS